MDSARCVVVTGASHGLGAATAIPFARQGARLALVARGPKPLEQTAQACAGAGAAAAVVCQYDLSDPEQATACGDRIVSAFPRLDLLVNNVAGWASGKLSDVSQNDVTRVIALTLAAPVLLTRAVLPGLLRAESPSVINVASTGAAPGGDWGIAAAPLVAAKRGVAGFSDALRKEFEPFGIRVSTVYPGAFHPDSDHDADWQDILRDRGHGDMGVKEVVDAVLFLASRPPTVAVESLVVSTAVIDH